MMVPGGSRAIEHRLFLISLRQVAIRIAVVNAGIDVFDGWSEKRIRQILRAGLCRVEARDRRADTPGEYHFDPLSRVADHHAIPLE